MPTGVATGAVRPGVFLAPLGVWILMAVLAVANGVVRETVIVPRVGTYRGHVLSTATLVGVILVVSAGYFAATPVSYIPLELGLVGIGWTALTVGFEFLVGYLEGTPVSETLGQYNVFAGQVWLAVPLTLLVAPLLFGSILAG